MQAKLPKSGDAPFRRYATAQPIKSKQTRFLTKSKLVFWRKVNEFTAERSVDKPRRTAGPPELEGCSIDAIEFFSNMFGITSSDVVEVKFIKLKYTIDSCKTSKSLIVFK